MFNCGDFSTSERRTEGGCLGVEELVAVLPILSRNIPASLPTFFAFEWKETSANIKLHTEESCITSALPRAIWLPIQGTQKPTSRISAGEVTGIQPRSDHEIRAVCKH
eukprot:CAMPEP_0169176758 /NCGR_PEP_ID=MMETSP1015-20121227/66040_1 /TAXON_ID=342587 /ORGANISM="Karlodinium micrum, Strain CCMP2283" /LENGTH=107 /DNA_ID=CAMNT_0009251285 /DNA_START=756 /DNA_END=1079 /DNA_ORIENTATION=-